MIDWGSELFTSLLWIAQVFVVVVVGFALVAWFLMRRTSWGRQFARFAIPYFTPGRDPASWRPLLTVLLLLLLIVIAVRIDVLMSYCINGLYTAMQDLDFPAFGMFLGIFGILATIHVVRSLFDYYVQQVFVIQWRVWLNGYVVDDWLAGQAYHRMRYTESAVDNPDQRIQEDVASFTAQTQTLANGAVTSVVSLVSFTVILWELSGPINVFGTEIPRAMTFLTYLYVIVATVIAFRIGRPLIRLNFLNEQLNASFRFALVRLREYSENIAFYRGENVERSTLAGRFAALINNVWAIVYRTLKFAGFNLSVSQLAVVFPLIIQAPRFFSGAITLGDVQQTATAFNAVEGALSFFRLAYDDFASYRATLNRLTGLLDANKAARELPSLSIEDRPEGLELREVTVSRPDEHTLIEDLNMSLGGGGSLLVRGPSGAGKTSLLRSLADLWPFARGTVSRPVGDKTLFLSQQPYVPLGTLRTALTYPEDPSVIDDERAREVLQQVQLGQLADRIDEQDRDWSRTLSPGEQQRLGFARILIARPSLVFLDEATSALDAGIEHSLYTLIREQLPDCVLVSVSHRTSLDELHADHLELFGDGRWELSVGAGQSRDDR